MDSSLVSRRQARVFAVAASLALIGAGSAHAATYNLNLVMSNSGFESGLTGWTYSGAGVNANTYLTNNEWNGGTWSSSSPFYSDANLATYYPGNPWGLNPTITHIDQSTVASDPTTAVGAAIGSNFAGSRQDGYQGHYLTGGVPGSPASYYDTNYQLRKTLSGSYAVGDIFTVTVWGNRGRLRQDWSTANADPANAGSQIRVGLARQTGANSFSNISIQDFTNWTSDGQWSYQTFSWTLGTATSLGVRLQLTGINNAHDRYVALDVGEPQVVPVPGAVWLFGSALGALAVARRYRRNS